MGMNLFHIRTLHHIASGFPVSVYWVQLQLGVPGVRSNGGWRFCYRMRWQSTSWSILACAISLVVAMSTIQRCHTPCTVQDCLWHN